MNTTRSVAETALIVVDKVLAVKPSEQFLIITNPSGDVYEISLALYHAALAVGAEATIVVQPEKTQLDFANRAALAAFGSEPDVCASISANKMGKDRDGLAHPQIASDGHKIDHVFHWQMDEKRTLRSIWTPGITVDMFRRTAGIDYALLKRRCDALSRALTGAESVRVTSPCGTDILVPVAGRKPMSDDGDFASGGAGGNIPAGEVFISPLPGRSEGTIVFDGSVSLTGGDMIASTPVRVVLKAGYVTEITGGKEAELLRASIEEGERKARDFAREGKLTTEEGVSYARNARGLGELGIGLNPAAEIRGNMLEDEKAFHTCHFAIGSNYDNDADAMIHLDCLVRNPTITVAYPDGRTLVIERDGVLTKESGAAE